MTDSSVLGRAGRLLRTVRHLRVDQVFHQAYYRALRPLVLARADRRPLQTPRQRNWSAIWDGPVYLPKRETAPGVFTMLGSSHQTTDTTHWNDPRRSRLWLYECHYLDDLAADPASTGLPASPLLERWMAANHRVSGVGWEPYPLSRRIVNIVKHLGRGGTASDTRMRSLARQSRALEDQLEYHLRGNHLLANAKALIFAGALCAGKDGDRWIRRGSALLLDQLQEQFLTDGGHFERCPMYHALVLWDLCDIIEVSRRSGVAALQLVAEACLPVLAKGLEWFVAMCHPDGDVSFFNDSTMGVAPRLAQILDYAARHGTDCSGTLPNGLTTLAASGYRSITCGQGTRLLVDLGSPGPTYQPGHAHAGTLSMELSIRGLRAVVNSGISTYAVGAQRSFERSTAAHSTVELNNTDSTEVWSTFRVGRRARITSSGQSTDGFVSTVWGTHDGYAHLPSQPLHTRRFVCQPDRLEIVDRLSAPVDTAVARFFLHPSLEVAGPCKWLLPDGGAVRITVAGGSPATRETRWHPGFGMAVPNLCVEIPFTGDELVTHFAWES